MPSWIAAEALRKIISRTRFLGDFEVQPGDRLVMMGAADRFAECADLFRGSSA